MHACADVCDCSIRDSDYSIRVISATFASIYSVLLIAVYSIYFITCKHLETFNYSDQ